MSVPSPVRPQTEKEAWMRWNGAPANPNLGVLTSSGTTVVVNNATTAVPFANSPRGGVPVPQSPPPQSNLEGTLAGKVLLLQATSEGVFAISRYPTLSPSALNPIVTLQTGTNPGTLLVAKERTVVTMPADHGWIQWLSTSGSASLVIQELI